MFEDIKITTDELAPDIIRTIEVAPADPGMDLPAIKIDGAYMKRAKFRDLLRPFMAKKEASDTDEMKFRNAVVDFCFRGWSGVTLRNLTRVSEYIMLNFDALEKAFEAKGATADTEIDFDMKDVKWVASKLNNEVFQRIVDALCQMEEYAIQKQAAEKNS